MEIIVKCDEHDEILKAEITKDKIAYVKPCKFCLEDAKDEGFTAGYEQGLAEGFIEGHDKGVEKGKQAAE